MDQHPIQGSSNTPNRLHATETAGYRDKLRPCEPVWSECGFTLQTSTSAQCNAYHVLLLNNVSSSNSNNSIRIRNINGMQRQFDVILRRTLSHVARNVALSMNSPGNIKYAFDRESLLKLFFAENESSPEKWTKFLWFPLTHNK